MILLADLFPKGVPQPLLEQRDDDVRDIAIPIQRRPSRCAPTMRLAAGKPYSYAVLDAPTGLGAFSVTLSNPSCNDSSHSGTARTTFPFGFTNA